MTEDSSSHWPIKRRYVYSETSRRAGLEFVYIFGHNEIGQKQPNIAGSKRAINAGSTFCGAQPLDVLKLSRIGPQPGSGEAREHPVHRGSPPRFLMALSFF